MGFVFVRTWHKSDMCEKVCSEMGNVMKEKIEIKGVETETAEGSQAADFLGMMQGYNYGLLYYLSEIKLETMEEGKTLSLEQLTEARLFSETSELHLFQCEDGWRAVSVKEVGEAEYIDELRPLSKEFQKKGKRQICVRKYISYDKDGQAFIALTRLYQVEGGEQDESECC